MKLFILLLLNAFLSIEANCQIIEGKITDLSNGEALAYVSIGVVNTSLGTITDENGNFKLDAAGQPSSAEIRISMISYKPQSYTIKELSDKTVKIQLIPAPIQLAEVIIKPSGKPRNIGTTSYTRIGNWCGWGGSNNGRGCEIGTMLALGNSYVQIKSLHVHVQRQAFDSCLFRLHIRNLNEKLPNEELLNDNILLTINKETGWMDWDLSKYHIVLKSDVAVSLEWVKVYHAVKGREMSINKSMVNEYVLFNKKTKKGSTYTRWGSEAKWNHFETGSPSMYLTVVD
jgi:hypothetical protein